MKNRIIKSLAFIFLLIGSVIFMPGCGGTKDASERRNYMMPRKDELPRNKKYTMVEKRKTYAVNKKHKKTRKR